MWQNLWILHRRDAFEPNAQRILHRTQIKGDQPIIA
jgi:taurine dioxygenase